MARILVSGLINIETTLGVESFPIPYMPVDYTFHRIHSSVSGVGYNVAKALTRLGHDVAFLSMIGEDSAAVQVWEALRQDGIAPGGILPLLPKTPQSVILYDREGKCRINVDLKNIQETDFPVEVFSRAATGTDLLVLCNINFSRPFLHLSRAAGTPVATDVHVISSLEDDYNREFMERADILFMSDEGLPVPPQEWAKAVMGRYPVKVLVIGLGGKGAVLGVRADKSIGHFPVKKRFAVSNTIGAGDALFSAFLHTYLKTADPYLSLQKAMLYAAWKISHLSASEGLLDAEGLEALHAG